MLQDRISGTNNSADMQWTEYSQFQCFECRVALLREDDDTFSAYAINLPGVASHGSSMDDALGNIREALAGALIEYCSEGGIPWDDDHIEPGIVERRILVNLADFATTNS